MIRAWLLFLVLSAGAAWAQAPSYSAENVVNSADYTPGPFAPNSVLSIFGTNLSWYTRALMPADITANKLPTMLGGAEVYVDNVAAPLLYVSATQINFIVPGNEINGGIKIRVVRQGVTGPEVSATLVDVAPALFALATGDVIATDALGKLLTAESPAHARDYIVLYATGLGKTEPNPSPGVIPNGAALLLWFDRLQVYLDGTPLERFRIKYAGVTPGSVGLYQINIELPPDLGIDPEIRVAVGAQSSLPGLKIPVR